MFSNKEFAIVSCFCFCVFAYFVVFNKRRTTIRRQSVPSVLGSPGVRFLCISSHQEFLDVFGISKELFLSVLSIYKEEYYSVAIKTGRRARTRPAARLLSAEVSLAYTLAYLRNSGGKLKLYCFIFGLSGSQPSVYLRFGIVTLLKTLRKVKCCRVEMPSVERIKVMADYFKAQTGCKIKNVIGCIDGTHISIEHAYDPQKQATDYSGYKKDCTCNNEILYTVDG